MKTFYKTGKRPGGNRCVLFRVETTRGNQFLCTETESDTFSVVEVDSAHFVELWRNDTYQSHLHVSQGTPETWVKDYKFKHAEDGFAYGESNPVPLADVHCAVRDEVKDVWRRRYLFFREYMGQQVVKRTPYVGFTNGITRIIWLLTYGAKYFPVMCKTDNADLLQLLAGLPDGKPRTIKELLDSGSEEFNAMHTW